MEKWGERESYGCFFFVLIFWWVERGLQITYGLYV